MLTNSPTISLQSFENICNCSPLTPQVIKIQLIRNLNTCYLCIYLRHLSLFPADTLFYHLQPLCNSFLSLMLIKLCQCVDITPDNINGNSLIVRNGGNLK